jgi:hypothetical protein
MCNCNRHVTGFTGRAALAGSPFVGVTISGLTISGVCAIMMNMDDDLDLDHLLRDYFRMCEQASVEPLPEDEAREQARALTKLLVPAFAVSFRQH